MDDGHSARLSRRTALRHWIAGSVSLAQSGDGYAGSLTVGVKA